MRRGTKEFADVQAQFERCAQSGYFGYVSSDMEKEEISAPARSFYRNGELNKIFLSYMAGYAAAKAEYQE